VSLKEEELLVLPEYLSSSTSERGSCGSIFIFLRKDFINIIFLLVHLLLAIVLSVPLRFAAFGYRFGIFKLSWGGSHIVYDLNHKT
jgi:hypothetical protein